MSGQLTTHRDTLRLFFTDDIYLVSEPFPLSAVAAREINESSNIQPEETKDNVIQYKTFDHLGKNQKNILILVNDPSHKVSTEKGSELLRNIVRAINLSANDFSVVNYAQYPGASYTQFKSFFSPKLAFCFGVSAADLQLNEQTYNEIHNLENGRIIFCSKLDQLADDQQSKKLLWESLKKLNL